MLLSFCWLKTALFDRLGQPVKDNDDTKIYWQSASADRNRVYDLFTVEERSQARRATGATDDAP